MATEESIRKALTQVFDPELRLDIITLGLVYGIQINAGKVDIRMTFTSPMCPYGPMLMEDVKSTVEKQQGVKQATVKIVFDPPWQPSEEVKAALGIG